MRTLYVDFDEINVNMILLSRLGNDSHSSISQKCTIKTFLNKTLIVQKHSKYRVAYSTWSPDVG